MDSRDQTTSLQGLVEENKALKATVEEQKQSLERCEDKIRKQKKALQTLKKVFKDDWNERIEKYKRNKEELARLLKEEEGLEKTVKELKTEVGQVSRRVREMDEEAGKLIRKVAKLRDGKGTNHGRPNKMEEGSPMQFVGGKEAALILPEEVWKIIFGKLSDPKDLWNCTNVCQLFEGILHQWKAGWMLEQALPHLYRHLSAKKLLECRLISKDCYAGVNHFLESHPSLQPHYGGNTDPRRLDFIHPATEMEIGTKNAFNFSPNEDRSIPNELFPNKFNCNPLIGRSVSLELRNRDTYEEEEFEVEESRWEKLYQFLKLFGKEIWYLAICIPENPTDWIEQKVVQLLTIDLFQVMPNLRKLNLYGMFDQSTINPHSLPAAPHFESFQADYYSEEDIAHVILQRYHNQIRRLELPIDAFDFTRNMEWSNLTDLHLNVTDEVESLAAVRMPRLRKLWLFLAIKLNFQTLMTVIKELCSTTQLNTLLLDGALWDKANLSEYVDPHLTAPAALKTLELADSWDLDGENVSSFPSHNLLLSFPYVENLNVFFRKIFTADIDTDTLKNTWERDMAPMEDCRRVVVGKAYPDEIVEINKYAYEGEMYKSNVWELMPLLKVLTFQWDVYTRDGYEEYSRKKKATFRKE